MLNIRFGEADGAGAGPYALFPNPRQLFKEEMVKGFGSAWRFNWNPIGSERHGEPHVVKHGATWS